MKRKTLPIVLPLIFCAFFLPTASAHAFSLFTPINTLGASVFDGVKSLYCVVADCHDIDAKVSDSYKDSDTLTDLRDALWGGVNAKGSDPSEGSDPLNTGAPALGVLDGEVNGVTTKVSNTTINLDDYDRLITLSDAAYLIKATTFSAINQSDHYIRLLDRINDTRDLIARQSSADTRRSSDNDSNLRSDINDILDGTTFTGDSIFETNLISQSNLTISGTLSDVNNEVGTAGQILTSTGVGVDWADVSAALGSSAFLNGGNAFAAAATLGTTDANSLSLLTNNTERLTIDEDGNVGIGTTTPSHLFDIRNGSSWSIRTGTGNYEILSLDNTAAGIGRRTGLQFMKNGVVDWRIGNDLGANALRQFSILDASASEFRLVIDDSGNIGIGTTNPNAKLDILSTAEALRLTYDDNNYTSLYYADSPFPGLMPASFNIDTTNSADYTDINILTNTNLNLYSDFLLAQGTEAWFDFSDGVYIGSAGGQGTPNMLDVEGGVVIGENYAADWTTAPTSGLLVEGNVGIGTTSPTSKLYVTTTDNSNPTVQIHQGHGSGTALKLTADGSSPTLLDLGSLTINKKGFINITSNNGGYSHIYNSNNVEDVFVIQNQYTSNSNRVINIQNGGLVVTNNGNVGIGTTSPGAKLDVVGSSGLIASFASGADQGDLNYMAVGDRAFFGYNGINSNTVVQGSSGKGIEFNVNNSTFGSGSVMAITSSGNIGLGGTITNMSTLAGSSMVVKSGNIGIGYTDVSAATGKLLVNGNVGIGTTSPSYKLDVSGTGRFTSDVQLDAGLTVTGNISSPGSGIRSEKFGSVADTGGYSNTTVVGYGATATREESVAIGTNSRASHESTAIGEGASATASFASIAVGKSSSAIGSGAIAIGHSSTADQSSSIALGRGAAVTSGNQLVIGSSSGQITSAFIGNGVTNANPLGFTLNATGGSGTDITGADLILAGGRGTGSAAGGDILFQTSDAGASGTTLRNLSTKMAITAAGNIGIGTTNPYAGLHVATPSVKIDPENNFKTTMLIRNGSEPAADYDEAQKLVILSDGSYGSGEYTGGIHFTRREIIHQGHYGSGIRGVTGLGGLYGNDLDFYVSGNEMGRNGSVMRITNAGRVGIGTTNPGYKLEVNGGIGLAGTVTTLSEGDIFSQYDGNAGATYPVFARYWDAHGVYPSSTFIFGNGANSVVGIEKPGGSNVDLFRVRATESTFNGSVGIGNANPVSLLTVGSDTTTNAEMTLWGEYKNSGFNNTNTFGFRHGALDRWRLITNQVDSDSDGFNFTFSALDNNAVDYNDWLTIVGETGYVGIGTTSPSYKLDVAGVTRSTGFRASQGGPDLGDDATNGYSFGGDGDTGLFSPGSGVGNGVVAIYTNDTQALTVNASQQLQLNQYGAGTLTTDASGNVIASSDMRLKNKVADFSRGLDDLLGITPIAYKWKSSTGFDTENTYYGFSAQNVKINIPEAVGEDPRGYLTLSDRPILATAINAIKEIEADLQLTTDNKRRPLFERITDWFKDKVFRAKKVETDELCIGEGSDQTCFTSAEAKRLKEMLSGNVDGDDDKDGDNGGLKVLDPVTNDQPPTTNDQQQDQQNQNDSQPTTGNQQQNTDNIQPITDVTPPVIELIGDEKITLTMGDIYNEVGAEATDDVDGDLTDKIIISGDTVDTTTVGTYTIIYTATDAIGNSASVSRVVVVEEIETEDKNDNPQPIIDENEE